VDRRSDTGDGKTFNEGPGTFPHPSIQPVSPVSLDLLLTGGTVLDATTGQSRRADLLIRDGKIAEVRAYHHGGKKNPQGDLVGFDHEGRGYRMLADWTPPAGREDPR